MRREKRTHTYEHGAQCDPIGRPAPRGSRMGPGVWRRRTALLQLSLLTLLATSASASPFTVPFETYWTGSEMTNSFLDRHLEEFHTAAEAMSWTKAMAKKEPSDNEKCGYRPVGGVESRHLFVSHGFRVLRFGAHAANYDPAEGIWCSECPSNKSRINEFGWSASVVKLPSENPSDCYGVSGTCSPEAYPHCGFPETVEIREYPLLNVSGHPNPHGLCLDGFMSDGTQCVLGGGANDFNKGPGGPTCNGTNPIHLGVASKYQKELDYVGGGAFPLRLERHYNSLDGQQNLPYARRGFVGRGWRHSYDRQIAAWDHKDQHAAKVRRPDGRVLYFVRQGSN
ncbi:MAG: DUF6531 domain-containing protein [Thermoanaerobaculia bacterium]|nr:DUF6531 domain-containing protein [Thermoanaerobaculia bacterium]